MNEDILSKYSSNLSLVKDFLEGRSEQDKRKDWSQEERKNWSRKSNNLCPVCDNEFSKKNGATKEHIHPLCLGGRERGDNIVVMCNKCNSSRNEVMFSVLSFSNISQLKKRWPANQTSVYEFVVWCHATIYLDYETMNSLSHINESFSLSRGLQYPPQNPEPQSKIQTPLIDIISQKSKEITKKISSFFNRPKSNQNKIRGTTNSIGEVEIVQCRNCYQSLNVPVSFSGTYRCPKCNELSSNHGRKAAANGKEKDLDNEQDMTKLDFEKILLDLLAGEEIKLTNLASRVNQFMKSEGYEEHNTTAFLKLFGLSRGFKKAIQTNLDGKLLIFEDENGATLVKSISESAELILVEVVDEHLEENSIDESEISKFDLMVANLYSRDISHLLFSTLSYHRLESGVLGGKMNQKLRAAGIIDPDSLFYPHYGKSRRKGLIFLIENEFNNLIHCSFEASRPNTWFVELKASKHLFELKNLLMEMHERSSGELRLLDFWGRVRDYYKENGFGTKEFMRMLGIPEGPVHETVWMLIERLSIDYTLHGFMEDGQSPVLSLNS
jgi:hypothetical protein